jgi:hypothetical protein
MTNARIYIEVEDTVEEMAIVFFGLISCHSTRWTLKTGITLLV